MTDIAELLENARKEAKPIDFEDAAKLVAYFRIAFPEETPAVEHVYISEIAARDEPLVLVDCSDPPENIGHHLSGSCLFLNYRRPKDEPLLREISPPITSTGSITVKVGSTWVPQTSYAPVRADQNIVGLYLKDGNVESLILPDTIRNESS